MRHLGLRRAALSLIATVALVLGLTTPAYAWPTTSFSACVENFCEFSYTNGTITWYNRTANIAGKVVDIGPGNTTAFFYAYAGAVLIDDQTRTADDETSLGKSRSFNFGIGDTNLVGGISDIYIWVCSTFGSTTTCGSDHIYHRP